jgi:hypothetical protein
LCRNVRKELEIKEIDEAAEKEELMEARRTGHLGGGVVDQPRPTLPWIT